MKNISSKPAILFVLISSAMSLLVSRTATAQQPSNVNPSSVVADYNADSLATGALSSWTPSSGSNPEAATVANATLYASASGTSPVYHSPTVANTGTIFNGHNYAYFNPTSGQFQGLSAADDLGLTGSTGMSLATVYATPASLTPRIAVSAGWADRLGVNNTWFDLHDRNSPLGILISPATPMISPLTARPAPAQPRLKRASSPFLSLPTRLLTPRRRPSRFTGPMGLAAQCIVSPRQKI